MNVVNPVVGGIYQKLEAFGNGVTNIILLSQSRDIMTNENRYRWGRKIIDYADPGRNACSWMNIRDFDNNGKHLRDKAHDLIKRIDTPPTTGDEIIWNEPGRTYWGQTRVEVRSGILIDKGDKSSVAIFPAQAWEEHYYMDSLPTLVRQWVTDFARENLDISHKNLPYYCRSFSNSEMKDFVDSKKDCDSHNGKHCFVNVSFSFVDMRCKYCDTPQI